MKKHRYPLAGQEIDTEYYRRAIRMDKIMSVVQGVLFVVMIAFTIYVWSV